MSPALAAPQFMKKGEAATSGPGWKERRTAKNRAEAEAVSRKLNEEKEAMKGVPPASEEELKELSARFNREMVRLLDATGGSSAHWFKLFGFMDQDKSGKVVYRELRDMVRSDIEGLGLKSDQLPGARLKSLWRALDDDNSGYITAKVRPRRCPAPPCAPVRASAACLVCFAR